MTTVYIALGSNLGDRAEMLRAAIERLRQILEVTCVSPVYETDPVGYLEQPLFLNVVIAGSTSLTAEDVLTRLQAIEHDLGRGRSFPNAPRLIDLDLLFYGDEIIDRPHITVPHPHLHERLFVLVPLADIAPDLIHPVLMMSIRELLDALGQPAGVRRMSTSAEA